MEIELGIRAVVSAAGIAILILGVWHVDRTWDEEGSRAFDAAATGRGSTAPASLDSALDAALRPPMLFIGGWALIAISYLLPRAGGASFEFTGFSVLAALTAAAIAAVGSLPMADAVRHRKARKKMVLSGLFAMFWTLLSIFTALHDDAPTEAWVFAFVGTVCIVMSMMVLWTNRKMGTSWEDEGRPNPNPVVYNLGGPLFVLGWFLFWLSMVSTNLSGVGDVVLELDWRTAVTFAAGLGVVPMVFMVDHAHDEGAPFVGLGTDGSVHGRFFETPIPFIMLWVLFGLSVYVGPTNSIERFDTAPLVFAALCIAMGLHVGLRVQGAIYQGVQAVVMRRAMGFAVLFLAIAVTIGWDGGARRWLAIVGAVSIIGSQMLLMGDRVRGRHWMQTDEPNPRPIVYSFGVIFFPFGWILVSWAASLAFR